jgi:glycopeptide antibiotics resistance protein
MSKFLSRLIFILYFLLLIWFILFKFQGILHMSLDGRSLNLVPFAMSGGKLEMIENVLAFVPYGLLLSVNVKRWPLGKKLFMILLTSLAFEVLQYIFAIGASDITDLITNTAGGLIGLLIYQIFRNFMTEKTLDKIINALMIIAFIIFVIVVGNLTLQRYF